MSGDKNRKLFIFNFRIILDIIQQQYSDIGQQKINTTGRGDQMMMITLFYTVISGGRGPIKEE